MPVLCTTSNTFIITYVYMCVCTLASTFSSITKSNTFTLGLYIKRNIKRILLYYIIYIYIILSVYISVKKILEL